MFEAISVHPTQDGAGRQINAGILAEILLYYSRVSIVAGPGMLNDLLHICGAETLLTLIEEGHVELLYRQRHIGIHTQNPGTDNELHTAVSFYSEEQSLQNLVPKAFIESIGREGRGRRLARRFIAKAKEIGYDERNLGLHSNDFLDTQYTSRAVTAYLKELVPEYIQTESILFRVIESGNSVNVETNIDYNLVNVVYHRKVPPSHSTVTTSSILTHLQGVQEKLSVAASNNAELLVSPADSQIVAIKCDFLLTRLARSQQEIASFQDFVFKGSKSVREVFEKGERTFNDLLPVLDKARKWKEWLADKPVDTDLLQEYYKAVVKETWVEKLPSRIVRWSIFNAIGLAFGPVGSLSVSATQEYLVEPLLRGWKPHQFIEHSLGKLLATPTN